MTTRGGARNTPQTKRITVEFPKDLEAVYSNGVVLTNTQSEFVVDFLQIMPRTNKGKAVSRVILPPLHAKRLHDILGQSITKFEDQFGEIKLPPTLVDQLFSGQPNAEGDDENEAEAGQS